MLESMFTTETAEATAQIVSGASDLGVTGLAGIVTYKIARVCEAGRAFLAAQTEALKGATEVIAAAKRASERVEVHADRTEAHQRRLEDLLEAAA